MVLAHLSRIFNWFSTRHEDFQSPTARGMKRTSSKDRSRDRILSDDEIRAVWLACEGTFGDLVKLLKKVASMKWEDVSIDGEWNVPNGAREKGTGGALVLPDMALEIIKARPRFTSNPHVLAG
jgi:hypothetical protein